MKTASAAPSARPSAPRRSPDVEVSGVVDQDVDPSEATDGRLDRSQGLLGPGDVERDDEEAVGRAEGFRRCTRTAGGGDDRVSSVQRGLHDLDTHAAPGTRDQPHHPIGHSDLLLVGARRLLHRHHSGTAALAEWSVLASFGDRVRVPLQAGRFISPARREGGAGESAQACPWSASLPGGRGLACAVRSGEVLPPG
jgi:hypothetical protein